jgi:ADP-sugar diphosphatase
MFLRRTSAIKHLNSSTKYQHRSRLLKPFSSHGSIMASFILEGASPDCIVQIPESLSKEQLLSFPPFKTWLSSIQHSLSTQTDPAHTFHDAPYQLRKIDVQAVDFFGKGRIGFLKLQTQVINDKGETLPGAVFMRGGSVGMLVNKF